MAAAIRCKFAGLTRQIVSSNLFRACIVETPVSRVSFHLSAHFNAVGQEIKMPSLSPTMSEGVIVKWLKKEGDVIAPGDVLCEIQTDKAVMSLETEEEGILAKILVGENVKDIKVGTSIALMVAEGEDWKTVEMPSSTGAATDSPVTPEPSGGGTVPGTSISMPSLSPTMTAGTIVKWVKKEGDTISPGDVLCEIQTDKAVMSFETEEEGILAKILVAEGTSDVQVGALIAVMVAEGENWQDVMIPSATGEPVKTESTASSAEPPTTTTTTTSSHEPTNYGPAVRGLLELYQLDASQITPSGKNKKILKSDVLQYITDRKLQPKPPLPVPLPGKKVQQQFSPAPPTLLRPVIEKFIDIELSSMRKTIAKRLTESKTTIPHAYATVDCDIDLLLSFRKQLKSAGVTVSVNDFVIKAVALALKECPLVNCLYVKDQAIPAPSIDVSVAVATDSGLITPIVKNANVKTIDEISAEVKELAKRARDGKLQLHEFQGGSFTISNLGMFGITEFSAIINPPQCGILAVGGGQPYIDIHGKTVTKMTSTLSYDARAISESAAADFLETVQILLNNPANLLLGLPPKKQRSVAH